LVGFSMLCVKKAAEVPAPTGIALSRVLTSRAIEFHQQPKSMNPKIAKQPAAKKAQVAQIAGSPISSCR
jgi:hypothetical protein